MESKLRKPLVTVSHADVTCTDSNLPVSRIPGSKLKPPGSTSKVPAPSITGKRARPNDEGPSAKRARVSNPSQESGSRLRSSSSTGSLNSTTSSTSSLKPSNSGGNLRNVKTTATVRPSVNRQVKPAGSKLSSVNVSRPPSGSANTAPPSGGSKGKKRPAWDLKGRLEDMEKEKQEKENQINAFMSQMSKITERVASLEHTNTHLSGKVASEEEQVTQVRTHNEELNRKLQEAEEKLTRTKRQLEQCESDFEFTKASLVRQKESLEAEIVALQQEQARLRASVAQLTSSNAQVQAELDTTKMTLEQLQKYCEEKERVVAKQEAELEEFNKKSQEWETMRRYLHNTIQELKGNIRVFCRVRPLLGDELEGFDGVMHHMIFPENDDKTLELQRLSDVSLSESTICGVKRDGKGRYAFSFDKVFTPESTQAEVFEEISQLVQSALDGYNVCIFAYGQTGSGKTYTMEGGPKGDEETLGMISRAVSQIFHTTRQLEEKSWQYEFEASYLEIYNESIRDLLGNHGNDVKHEIKLGTNGNDVTVTNLTNKMVTKEDQILDMLKTASKNRAVGETLCNERSSRSHSVFRLKITGLNEITGESCKGTLSLVDLAGSERLKDSGATGQRLKETQNINKSLSNLGNVIMALANKESHVPFRNSKLTYLLQNSLGGNSKTLMFVNISPKEENFSESLNSLRFATKVNQCNIGTATKKINK